MATTRRPHRHRWEAPTAGGTGCSRRLVLDAVLGRSGSGHYVLVPFNVELRDEAGVTLDSVEGVHGLAGLLPSADDTSSTVLRFIDPYGNTVINRLQAGPLVRELQPRLRALTDEAERDAVAAVVDLVERCASDVHLYVWFVGD